MTDKIASKPILVTGSHRSGSTWVGRMIAKSPIVSYIHEPFNLKHKPGMCKAKFEFQFPYVCDQNESFYYQNIRNCIGFKYYLTEDLKKTKNYKEVAHSIREFVRFTHSRIFRKRPLIKDPIAVFSADWLAKRFNMNVIVVIRHPAAFASSLKKVGWRHPFNNFTNQTLLMKHHLAIFKDEINRFCNNERSIVDESILLWKLIHHMILKYQANHPDWIFVKHEDISSSPVVQFKNIYDKLNLPFKQNSIKHIETYSFAKENYSRETRNSKLKLWRMRLTGDYSEKRKINSQKNAKLWKNFLTPNEIEKIKQETSCIAKYFYDDKDW